MFLCPPGAGGGKAEEGLCLPLGVAEASLVPWRDQAGCPLPAAGCPALAAQGLGAAQPQADLQTRGNRLGRVTAGCGAGRPGLTPSVVATCAVFLGSSQKGFTNSIAP